MEQVLNKLSEIETTANYIMEQAADKKQDLTAQMEEPVSYTHLTLPTKA